MKTSRLIAAIRAGNRAEVLTALAAGADIEEADMHGFPGLPLRTACFTGNTAIVGDLIKHGADVNATGSDGPSAPLRLARRRGHHDIFGLLLQHGATIPTDVSAPQAPLEISRPPLEFARATPRPTAAAAATTPDAYPGKLIEFTPPDPLLEAAANSAADEGDFGEQTRLLSMDLFFDQDEAPAAIPEEAAGAADPGPPPRRNPT